MVASPSGTDPECVAYCGFGPLQALLSSVLWETMLVSYKPLVIAFNRAPSLAAASVV